MKLPNHYGSISKIGKKNRRNNYMVRATIGINEKGNPIRKIIGYVKNRSDGLKLLAQYHNNPFDLDYRNLTFEDLWKDVIKDIEKQVENGKMSDSNRKALTSAYNNYCTQLYNEKIIDLKYKTMQSVINNAKKKNGEELGGTAKRNIKTICVKIYDKAINEYELDIKNQAIKLKSGERKKSDKHTPFTEEELSILWDKSTNNLVKIFLILCYTGLRPNELFITNKENIFINDEYFITGSKTEAGKDRIIPIHPKIKDIILYFYNKEEKQPFKSVIDKFNYNKFSRSSTELMKALNFEHTPYDGRHTFITKMKQAGANDFILKRIVGHSIQDVTEKFYTHREIRELIEEVKKIS